MNINVIIIIIISLEAEAHDARIFHLSDPDLSLFPKVINFKHNMFHTNANC